MVTVRLRHPNGVCTLDLQPDTQTIADLKALIFSSTDIDPSRQEIRYGYPPKLLPDLPLNSPLASIPISRGEQLLVANLPEAVIPIAPSPSSLPTPAPSVKALSQTLSAPSPLPPPKAEPGGESVALPGRDAGFLQLRVVPDDNACLFSAVAVVFEGGIEGGHKLRSVVADAIRRDEETYSDVMLGKSRQEYVEAILKPDTWGGAIELSIFAKHYRTEISSFDVATGRCDRFGEGEYDSRCVLVYSGIHYDAITSSPVPVSPPAFHTTVFPVSDPNILPAATKLVAQLKARHYYTDTSTFDLRCGICGTGLTGEKGAREHAMQTGHVEFGEY
ncbi:ubiquitin thioesterase OTU1, partial [Tremellales sp. Uapishka_1]